MKKLIILALLLSITVCSFAADRIVFRKFSGLQTRINPYEIKEEESPDMSNFVLDEAGSLRERNLFQQYNSVSIGNYSIPNVYKFYKSSDLGYLICSAGTRLYQATGGALSPIVTENTVSENSQWAFETFLANDGITGAEEVVYAANNGTGLLTWDGLKTTFQDRATVNASNSGKPAENCNILRKHKSRLFAAGASTYPYRIYYSSLSNGINWSTSGGTIDLPAYEKIMALEVLSDTLYIFTRTSIYALLGDTPNEFTIQKTLSTIGTHAVQSVQLGNRLIFFLNKAGVFAFDGVQSVNISEPIQPTIDDVSDTYIGQSTAIYDNRGRFWLSYTPEGGSTNTKILIYDTVIKQWYMLDGISLSGFFKTEGGSDRGELYAGNSNNTGILWKLQDAASLEQITHETKAQLQTGVTFNTVFLGVDSNPLVDLPIYHGKTYSNNMRLYLSFDGGNEATSITDLSEQNHTISFNGNAELNTGTRKHGTASLYLDGNGDFITSPNSSDWDIFASNSDNWTVSFWMRFEDARVAAEEDVIISHMDNANDYWWIRHIQGAGFYLQAVVGAVGEVEINAVGEVTDTEWHHYALCKVGSEYGVYIDGLIKGYVNDASTVNMSQILAIGEDRANNSSFFDGYLDEIIFNHSNIFDASPDAALTDTITVPDRISAGGLVSDNLSIGAAGQASLGTITWQENLSTNADIQFTTRTGVTDDTTYDTWTRAWVSTSTAVMEVTHATVGSTRGIWDIKDANNTNIALGSNQTRNVLYYEWDDQPNPDCIAITVSDALSQNDYIETFIPQVDLSSYKFVGFWLKSPVTGASVKIDLAEVSPTSVTYATTSKMTITANTVTKNIWEYHYGPISSYSSANRDAIIWARVTYLGDDNGTVFLGKVHGYDFLDSGETITSTPDNFIQYKAILGINQNQETAQLKNLAQYVVTLSYSLASSVSETSLTSYWQSKIFDNNSEYNKLWQWAEFTVKSESDVTGDSVSLEYILDDGIRSGTVTSSVVVTGHKTKMRFNFPSGTYGKSVQITVRETDLDSDLEINNGMISFVQEGGS